MSSSNTVLEGSYNADQLVGVFSDNARAIWVIVNITDLEGGTPSVTPKIQVPDGVGGVVDLLVGNAMTTVSEQILKVGLDYTASPNAVAKEMVPGTFNVVMAHADADDVTYTVDVLKGQ